MKRKFNREGITRKPEPTPPTSYEWTVGEEICTRESTDYRKASDGGDYSFYERPVFLNGEKVGAAFKNCSGPTMCELSGTCTAERSNLETPIGRLIVSDQITGYDNEHPDEVFVWSDIDLWKYFTT